MKTYIKEAAFILAVIAVAKLAKKSVTLPTGIADLLP